MGEAQLSAAPPANRATMPGPLALRQPGFWDMRKRGCRDPMNRNSRKRCLALVDIQVGQVRILPAATREPATIPGLLPRVLRLGGQRIETEPTEPVSPSVPTE